MIGVDVHPAEEASAREFFELLKTPWEFYSAGKTYEVILSSRETAPAETAPLILHFWAGSASTAPNRSSASHPTAPGSLLSHAGKPLPIYGPCATFATGDSNLLSDSVTGAPALVARREPNQTFVQVGYRLFHEVEFLLREGQPAANARYPTLERHIAFVRDVITRAETPLLEIPPVPASAPFMVCLTHDIDHPVMRRHRWDHTMAGFIGRAAFAAPLNWLRQRISFADLLRQWAGVTRLPLVYLGWVRDPWREFAAGYLAIERGLGATYFFIPERDKPGRKTDGAAPAKRACRYSLADVRPQLKQIADAGQEIGLHGIDAWCDTSAGREEQRALSAIVGRTENGVRMHWLYFDGRSPQVLEGAGFSYDSTFGYNATVGFRAGTTQAFRPGGCSQLMELPLHVMDTALFYPSYLNLAPAAAQRLVLELVDEAATHGGALTFNWHDRSLFPDRLWGTVYVSLITEMKRRGAWFPTAAQAVAWFRQRRNLTFGSLQRNGTQLHVTTSPSSPATALPGMVLRLHLPCARQSHEPLASGPRARWVDQPLTPSATLSYQN